MLADFCPRTAEFLSGSNRVKICRAISLPQTSLFFVALLGLYADLSFDLRHVGKDACSRDSHDIFLRRARAPTNCLSPPHTSRPRRFEI